MNPLDRLLQDEMNCLLDRLAASAPEGALGGVSGQHPELRALIEAVEARLSAVRASLLDGYRQWRSTIEEYEDLWALFALKSGEAESLAERRAA